MPLIQEYNKLYEQNSNIKKIYVNGNRVWPAKKTDPKTIPLYVENITNANETLTITKVGSPSTVTFEYSTDLSQWSTLGSTDTTITHTLASGEKIYLRSSDYPYSNSNNNYTKITGVSKVGGNLLSLGYGSDFIGKTTLKSTSYYGYCGLFQTNTNLIDASELLLIPTTIYGHCYRQMFMDCSSLIHAPELPATTIATYCYQRMFSRCTSLETAPVLPATQHQSFCYQRMFQDSTKVKNVTCYLTSRGLNATQYWLSGASSTGTFTKKAGTTFWSRDTNGIPYNWTVEEA